jgi:hypothetical protein
METMALNIHLGGKKLYIEEILRFNKIRSRENEAK